MLDQEVGEQGAGGAQWSQKRAVALRYDEGTDAAPVVVATGRGALAEQIIQAAIDHGIPITEDPHLVEALAKLDLGEIIPPELYPVVAEVLVFVRRADADKKPGARLPSRDAAGPKTGVAAS